MSIQQSPENLLKSAWHDIRQNNIPQSVATCRQLNQQYPDNAEGWYVTSYLAFRLRDAKQSLMAIDRALALSPDSVLWRIHKAHIALMMGEKGQALLLMSELENENYDDVKICAEIALISNQLQNYDVAEKYYLQAIRLSPDDGQLYFNLASIQRYRGAIDDAEASLDKSIELSPDDCEAYWLRSSLRRQTTQSNHLVQLTEKLSSKPTPVISQVQIQYALAKEHEDLKQYEESFKHLKQGADLRRNNMQYNLANDRSIIEKIMKVFDVETFNQLNNRHLISKNVNDQAIFIVGLPRTGSTLVERIISQHDQVYNAGELNNFAVEMMKQCQRITEKLPQSRTELVELTANINFADLGRAYIQSTRPGTSKAKRFIDKLPLNSLYIGLIHLALPNAKIIHVQRDPMDTCYSMYKQLFTHGYPFSYDLSELANYYIVHHQLMEHWKQLLPGIIHSVQYEEMVADIDTQAKGLIGYCDLDWQKSCTEFHLNSVASVTASATQVRQSIYKSSIGKWRNYEQQLLPMKRLLEQANIIGDQKI